MPSSRRARPARQARSRASLLRLLAAAAELLNAQGLEGATIPRIAAKAGILRERITLDPGIGFAKTSAQNRAAFAHIARLKERELPILIGMSRKRFLGADAPARETLAGTIAANLAAASAGASIFRVPDIAEHAAALKIFGALRNVSSHL